MLDVSKEESAGARYCWLVIPSLLLLLCVLPAGVLAQSGRRRDRPSPSATPLPVPGTETPKIESAPQKPESSKLKVLVTSRFESGIVSASSARAILASFSTRLKEEQVLEVKEGSATSSTAARTIAEAGKEGYVVWLNLIPDTYDSNSRYGGDINYDDIIVKYTVFTPGSGKETVDGRLFYQAPRRRNRSSSLPGIGGQPLPPSRFPVEYTPERAGRETASRVLDSLKEILPQS
jgi:hypothetical protein